ETAQTVDERAGHQDLDGRGQAPQEPQRVLQHQSNLPRILVPPGPDGQVSRPNPVAVRRAAAAIALLSLVSCATARNYPDVRGPRFSGNYAGPPPSVPPAALSTVTFNIKFGRQID